jgi:hypothetical protein
VYRSQSVFSLRVSERLITPLIFRVADEEPFNAERLYRYADHYWRKASLTERLRLHQQPCLTHTWEQHRNDSTGAQAVCRANA